MTIDLVALALHKSYIASDSVIIGDGIGLSIAKIGYFTLPSLPTPYYLPMCYMCLLCLRTLFRSLLFVPITLLMSYFFYSFFQVQDCHSGSRATQRRSLLLAEVRPPSVFRLNSVFFNSVLVFCNIHVA